MSTNNNQTKSALKNQKLERYIDIISVYKSQKKINDININSIKQYEDSIAKLNNYIVELEKEIDDLIRNHIEKGNALIRDAKRLSQDSRPIEAQLAESNRIHLNCVGKLENARNKKAEAEKQIRVIKAQMNQFSKLKNEMQNQLKELGANVNLDNLDESKKVTFDEHITLIDETPLPSNHKDKKEHPFGRPGRSREEMIDEKIDKKGFLASPEILNRNLKNIGLQTGLGSENLLVYMSNSGAKYSIESKKVSCDQDDDESLSKLIDIAVEAEKSKFEAAGKLDQFDISKLRLKAAGAKEQRLKELMIEKGVGVPRKEQKTNEKQASNEDTIKNTSYLHKHA